MLDRYEKFSDMTARIAAWLAMACLAVMVSHIMLEIALRNLFSVSTYILEEFVSYGVAAATFLGLAAALRDGELIRVSLLIEHLSPAARRWLEAASAAAALAATGFIGWFVARVVIRNFERGVTSTSMLETPLWMPQTLILFGLFAFALQLVAHFIRALSGRLDYPRADADAAIE